MAKPSNADAKDWIALAERMGIPAGEAVRHVERLIELDADRRERERTSDILYVDVVDLTGEFADDDSRGFDPVPFGDEGVEASAPDPPFSFR